MSTEPPVPETSVLAVASHVVSGNVGNKIAVFVLQSMGCDVSALNTVQFSNHTGYKQWKGTRVSAQEITDLWEGLKQSYLDGVDMMLSGYVPGAEAVTAVGNIGKELRQKSEEVGKPGNFFWVLDPVMGDNGRLYVAETVVPAYKSLIHYADLILPNQFEAELLSGVKITDRDSLEHAIRVLHQEFGVPHVVITSVSIPLFSSSSAATPQTPRTMSVVGSSMTSDRQPRVFRISFPVFEAYFSGTGDMFAALMVVRMREAVANYDKLSNGVGEGKGASSSKLGERRSWLSDDTIGVLDLPLARAAEKVLASMHEVLDRTCESMNAQMRAIRERRGDDIDETTLHLLKSRAAELRLTRNLGCLRDPTIEYRAEKM
ncbi:Ribokinase-like protein [Annulohypoxylon maeteangense]|uniref:Ribokinase-like protein n=1 Tax=Annulohypoxylon maeteangense TaxID=1927788 RepID=UPI002007CC19|nr:Ribokinase-like protein [Annulohypoxylon maeteangense]KAI0890489.1 Ribokinase-like protein [Annulohypoxylon maeteangense]